MKRSGNILSIVVIAALALSAISVTSAQARTLTAGAYPATVTGKDANTEHGKLIRITFGNGARYVECTITTLSTVLTKAETEVTFTPTFSECFSNGFTAVPATVTPNGCHVVFHATGTTEGQISFRCPEGQAIQVHIYENATKHAENKPFCTYDIGPQGPITGATLSAMNSGTSTEGVRVNLKELAIFNATSTMGNLILCGVNATSGHAFTTASLRGEYLLAGSSSGVHTPIMIE
ncbi:MAG TPA: hypothetical protein VEW07_07905 [Solirubrobacterales bacterium]|nr:hypothetical protein [Solirubrobacterales bacterium]